MQDIYIKIYKKTFFLFIRLLRIFTKKFDKKISLFLSKTKWSSGYFPETLEVTTTVGCAMMCDYCPQEAYKKNGKEYPKVLSFDTFKDAMKNVDNKVKIHWTGFSEPLHCKEFTLMADYLNERGFKQHISTTMFGRDHCREYMCETRVFEQMVYHLPDNNNRMHLKVTDKYLDYLEKSITFQSQIISKKKFTVMVIGNDFQKQVRELIDRLLNKKVILESQIYIRKLLVTRAGSVQVDDIEGFDQQISFSKKKFNKNNKKLFYCGYGRLKQGVLLTNGTLAICANDYSIDHNVGSLIDNKLDDLYKHKKLFSNDEFIYGEKSPCKNCEFYESL